MSDCSTEAMKPKKRPEVCPSCEHSMIEHVNEYEPSLIHFNCLNCGCSITRERKEPRKTCETCDRYYNVRPFMRMGACALDDLDENGCAPIHNADDEACDRWLEVELPLEQRYQQLERVTRDMYKAIAPMHEHCNEDTCLNLGDMGWEANYCFHDFREQLEALGVDINAGM